MIVIHPINNFLFSIAAPIIVINAPTIKLFNLTHKAEKMDISAIINQAPNTIYAPLKIIINFLFIGSSRDSIYLPVQKMLIHNIFNQIVIDKLEKCLLFDYKYVANMKLLMLEVLQ